MLILTELLNHKQPTILFKLLFFTDYLCFLIYIRNFMNSLFGLLLSLYAQPLLGNDVWILLLTLFLLARNVFLECHFEVAILIDRSHHEDLKLLIYMQKYAGIQAFCLPQHAFLYFWHGLHISKYLLFLHFINLLERQWQSLQSCNYLLNYLLTYE